MPWHYLVETVLLLNKLVQGNTTTIFISVAKQSYERYYVPVLKGRRACDTTGI